MARAHSVQRKTVTTIASWLNLWLMARILYKRGLFKPDALLKKRLLKMVAASKVMALVLFMAGIVAAPFYAEGVFVRTTTLLVAIGLGGFVYGTAVMSLKAYDVKTLKKILKRQPRVAKE